MSFLIEIILVGHLEIQPIISSIYCGRIWNWRYQI